MAPPRPTTGPFAVSLGLKPPPATKPSKKKKPAEKKAYPNPTSIDRDPPEKTKRNPLPSSFRAPPASQLLGDVPLLPPGPPLKEKDRLAVAAFTAAAKTTAARELARDKRILAARQDQAFKDEVIKDVAAKHGLTFALGMGLGQVGVARHKNTFAPDLTARVALARARQETASQGGLLTPEQQNAHDMALIDVARSDKPSFADRHQLPDQLVHGFAPTRTIPESTPEKYGPPAPPMSPEAAAAGVERDAAAARTWNPRAGMAAYNERHKSDKPFSLDFMNGPLIGNTAQEWLKDRVRDAWAFEHPDATASFLGDVYDAGNRPLSRTANKAAGEALGFLGDRIGEDYGHTAGVRRGLGKAAGKAWEFGDRPLVGKPRDINWSNVANKGVEGIDRAAGGVLNMATSGLGIGYEGDPFSAAASLVSGHGIPEGYKRHMRGVRKAGVGGLFPSAQSEVSKVSMAGLSYPKDLRIPTEGIAGGWDAVNALIHTKGIKGSSAIAADGVTPEIAAAIGFTPEYTQMLHGMALKRGWYEGELVGLVGMDLLQHAYSSPPPMALRIAQNFGRGAAQTGAFVTGVAGLGKEIATGHGQRALGQFGGAIADEGAGFLSNPLQAAISDPFTVIPAVGAAGKTAGMVGHFTNRGVEMGMREIPTGMYRTGEHGILRELPDVDGLAQAGPTAPELMIGRGQLSKNLWTQSFQRASDALVRKGYNMPASLAKNMDRLVRHSVNTSAHGHVQRQVAYRTAVGALEGRLGGKKKRAEILLAYLSAGGRPDKILEYYESKLADKTGKLSDADEAQARFLTDQVIAGTKDLSEADQEFIATARDLSAHTSLSHIEMGRFRRGAMLYRQLEPLLLAAKHKFDRLDSPAGLTPELEAAHEIMRDGGLRDLVLNPEARNAPLDSARVAPRRGKISEATRTEAKTYELYQEELAKAEAELAAVPDKPVDAGAEAHAALEEAHAATKPKKEPPGPKGPQGEHPTKYAAAKAGREARDKHGGEKIRVREVPEESVPGEVVTTDGRGKPTHDAAVAEAKAMADAARKEHKGTGVRVTGGVRAEKSAKGRTRHVPYITIKHPPTKKGGHWTYEVVYPERPKGTPAKKARDERRDGTVHGSDKKALAHARQMRKKAMEEFDLPESAIEVIAAHAHGAPVGSRRSAIIIHHPAVARVKPPPVNPEMHAYRIRDKKWVERNPKPTAPGTTAKDLKDWEERRRAATKRPETEHSKAMRAHREGAPVRDPAEIAAHEKAMKEWRNKKRAAERKVRRAKAKAEGHGIDSDEAGRRRRNLTDAELEQFRKVGDQESIYREYERALEEFLQMHLDDGGIMPARIAYTKARLKSATRAAARGGAKINPKRDARRAPPVHASTGKSFREGHFHYDANSPIRESVHAQRLRVGLGVHKLIVEQMAERVPKGTEVGKGQVALSVENFKTLTNAEHRFDPDTEVSHQANYEAEASVRGKLHQALKDSGKEGTGDFTTDAESYLIPKAAWDRMLEWAKPVSMGTYNKIMREYQRTLISVFPGTVIGNTLGSIPLALASGAGPQSFRMARRTMERGGHNRDMAPHYLYGKGPSGSLETDARLPHTHYMNKMRAASIHGEDYSRIAAYWAKALPYVRREGERLKREAEAANKKWHDDNAAFVGPRPGKPAEPTYTRFGTNPDRASHDVPLPRERSTPDLGTPPAVLSTEEAFEKAARMFAAGKLDNKVLDSVLDHVEKFMGDTHMPLRGAAAQALQTSQLVLFLPWVLHMTKLVLWTLPIKHPRRTLFLNSMARYGDQYRQEHGAWPQWMSGFFPLMHETSRIPGMESMPGGKELQEWTHAFTLMQLNPQSTAGGLMQSLTSDKDVADRLSGAVNPFAQSAWNFMKLQHDNRDMTMTPDRKLDMWRVALNEAWGLVPGGRKIAPMQGMRADSLPWVHGLGVDPPSGWEIPKTYTDPYTGQLQSPYLNAGPRADRGWSGLLERIFGFGGYQVPNAGPITQQEIGAQFFRHLADENPGTAIRAGMRGDARRALYDDATRALSGP